MNQSGWHGTRADRLEQLVSRSQSGDQTARRQMHAFIVHELDRLATTYMRRDRGKPHRNVGMAAMVNQAITQMAATGIKFEDQHHFYLVAAPIMRSVLVKYEKERRASEAADGDQVMIIKDTALGAANIDLIKLDEILERFKLTNPDAAMIFDLHYFAGLSLSQITLQSKIPDAVVNSMLRFAKAWVLSHLQDAKRSDERALT